MLPRVVGASPSSLVLLMCHWSLLVHRWCLPGSHWSSLCVMAILALLLVFLYVLLATLALLAVHWVGGDGHLPVFPGVAGLGIYINKFRKRKRKKNTRGLRGRCPSSTTPSALSVAAPVTGGHTLWVSLDVRAT